jgi:hypothetical protein
MLVFDERRFRANVDAVLHRSRRAFIQAPCSACDRGGTEAGPASVYGSTMRLGSVNARLRSSPIAGARFLYTRANNRAGLGLLTLAP